MKNLQTKLKTVGEVKRVENGEGGDTVEMCDEGERVKEDAGGIVTGEDNEPVTSPSVSAREALLIGEFAIPGDSYHLHTQRNPVQSTSYIQAFVNIVLGKFLH